MDNISKFLKIFGIIVVLLIVGVVVGWLGTRESRNAARVAPPPEPSISSGTSAALPVPAPILPRNHIEAPASPEPAISVAAPKVMAPIPVAPPVATITNWEDRLDDILAGEEPEKEKANTLLEMFPRLPSEGQVEIAQHLANLVEDEDYAALGMHLANPALPEEVLDILLTDLLNRPNAIKLPALVGVARDATNPKASEAKDILELYLEEDYGTDWLVWEQKADEWVKNNPD